MALKFNFRLLTQSPETVNVQSGKLGASKAEKFTDLDVGKPVKKGTQGNFVLCAAGDEIEGFIDNIDAGGTTDGFSFGGVAIGKRGFRKSVLVKKANSQDINVLGYVIADTNAAAGTANTGTKLGVVKQSGTSGDAGKGLAVTAWRIVSLAGDVASSTADSIEAVIELQ